MSFTAAVRRCLTRYATFSGRAPRSEYWWFMLFVVAGGMVLDVVDRMLFGVTLPTAAGAVTLYNSVLGGIFSLATLIPLLAAGWRRMHDTGRSGLYLLYPLIAVMGVISYAGLVSGLGPVMNGDFGMIFAQGAGLVLMIAVVIVIFSPLIVLWWLTRPTQPRTNQWGPPPLAQGRAAA
jgi:uncharacterized membrane protein YhaH (DUF805 family)